MVKLEYKADGPIPQLTQLGLVSSVNGLSSDHDVSARRLVERAKHMHQSALARATGSDDRDHLTALDGKIHAVQYIENVPIPADVCLVDVVRLEYGHRHSCLIASIGNSLDACTDGYTVAIAAMAMLAITIHITSIGCVDTGR